LAATSIADTPRIFGSSQTDPKPQYNKNGVKPMHKSTALILGVSCLISHPVLAQQPVAPVCAPYNVPSTRVAVEQAVSGALATQATAMNGIYYSIIDVTPVAPSAPDINGNVTTTQTRPLPQITGGVFEFGIYSTSVQLNPYSTTACTGSVTVIINGYAINDSTGRHLDGMNMPFGGRWNWNFSIDGNQLSLAPTDVNGAVTQQPNGPAQLITLFYNIPPQNIAIRPATMQEIQSIAHN
jgi:hypothetical protein